MTWEEFLFNRGPSIAVFIYLGVLGVKAVWNFWQTKVYAGVVERDQNERDDRKKREDRLFEIIEHNAQAWTEMKVTLVSLQKTLDNHGEALGDVVRAVDKKAVLYEIIQDLLKRPENRDLIEEAEEAEEPPAKIRTRRALLRGTRPNT